MGGNKPSIFGASSTGGGFGSGLGSFKPSEPVKPEEPKEASKVEDKPKSSLFGAQPAANGFGGTGLGGTGFGSTGFGNTGFGNTGFGGSSTGFGSVKPLAVQVPDNQMNQMDDGMDVSPGDPKQKHAFETAPAPT